MSATTDTAWPEKPYRGLNYFRPQDRPLLGGRDDDIDVCATLLAHSQTRVLLLHGATGCGKSSFLRAGLIPVMEEQGGAYLFLKTPGADDDALFIRCTESPVDQIARQVFLFANAPFELRTPIGTVSLSLTPALLGAKSWEDYLDLCRDEYGLCDSLRKISELIPQTLVLIVDQAEEVLTLNPGEEGFRNRAAFFGFLRAFQRLEFASRIIVTLRTEYFGRFVDATQVTHSATPEFQHFYLGELSQNALVEAILRPTSRTPIASFGIPYSVYGFEFQTELPRQIVTDIVEARYTGPALPVLQLVCLGLYESLSKHNASLIRETVYVTTGGVEGHLIEHIKAAIRPFYQSEADFDFDLVHVRALLQRFYTMQDDGTVVARPHDRDWAIAELRTRRLRATPEIVVEALASPQTLILRNIRTVKSNGKIADELTLGHDSVALALERWIALDAQERLRLAEERRVAEVTRLEEEVTESRSAYADLLKAITPSTWASLATVVVTVGFAVGFFAQIQRISSDVVDVVERIVPSWGNSAYIGEVIKTVLLVSFSLAAAQSVSSAVKKFLVDIILSFEDLLPRTILSLIELVVGTSGRRRKKVKKKGR